MFQATKARDRPHTLGMNEEMIPPILGQSDATPSVGCERYSLADVSILLSPEDNVAVARRDLARGVEITCAGRTFSLPNRIPAGHKLALCEIETGSPIYKYSQMIGKASRLIRTGEWVHTHNVDPFHDLDQPEFAIAHPHPPELPADLPKTFLGYRRPDGRVGTRNYVAVIPTSNCASHVCQLIAERCGDTHADGVDGVVALPHQEGCGHHEGPDVVQLERTIRGMILNPNVAAVVMVGLGCEINALSLYATSKPERLGLKPFAGLEIQRVGGTSRAAAEGVQRVQEMAEVARSCRRTAESADKILVGLNCGGSDAFSGISANPALGYASDLLVAAGGSVILAETPEIYGAEHLLTRRAADVETGKRLIQIIKRYQEYVACFGASLDSNPAPGNKHGGITNIVEKSLGAVMKGGSTVLRDVVDYAGQITRPGLTVMDTPGYDPVSITGIAAGGCNIIAFTTGRGSAIGFPIVPVLKISTNTRIFQTMNDNMDINAGEVIDGICTVQEKGIEIYRQIVRVASGERTKSELLGHKEFAPWRIGPVM
jgi:altronate hydrolase